MAIDFQPVEDGAPSIDFQPVEGQTNGIDFQPISQPVRLSDKSARRAKIKAEIDAKSDTSWTDPLVRAAGVIAGPLTSEYSPLHAAANPLQVLNLPHDIGQATGVIPMDQQPPIPDANTPMLQAAQGSLANGIQSTMQWLSSNSGIPGTQELGMPEDQAVGRGIGNAVQGAAEGLTTPANLATLPVAGANLGKISRPVLGLFATQMAGQMPEVLQNTYQTVTDPNATTEQKSQAVTQLGLHTLMTAGAAHGAADLPTKIAVDQGMDFDAINQRIAKSDFANEMEKTAPATRQLTQGVGFEVSPEGNAANVRNMTESEKSQLANKVAAEEEERRQQAVQAVDDKQNQPANVNAITIDQSLGVNRPPVPLDAARQTIINETLNKLTGDAKPPIPAVGQGVAEAGVEAPEANTLPSQQPVSSNGMADRLNELKGMSSRTPTEEAEMTKLTKESNAKNSKAAWAGMGFDALRDQSATTKDAETTGEGAIADKSQQPLKQNVVSEPPAVGETPPQSLKAPPSEGRKFSPLLESDIKHKLDTFEEDKAYADEGETFTRNNAIKELMQDMDDEDNYAKQHRKELQDFGIEKGIYKEYSKDQLKNITQTGVGKKYDFKRGDKYYVFDSWKPLEEGQSDSLKAPPAGVRNLHPDTQKEISDLRIKPGSSAHDVVTAIAEQPDKFGKDYSALAGFLAEHYEGPLRTAKVSLGTEKGSDSASYDPLSHTTFLHAADDNSSLAFKALHESAHAATVWQFENPKTEIQRRAAQTIGDLMAKAKNELPMHVRKFVDTEYKNFAEKYRANDESGDIWDKQVKAGINPNDWNEVMYAMTHPSEFIAGIFSSPELRSFLNDIPVGDRTLWERVKDSVKTLLGIKPKSILDEAFNAMMAVGSEGKEGAEASTPKSFKAFPSRNYTPAVKGESGKVYTGKDHDEASSIAQKANDPWRQRGFTNKEGKFLTMTEVARERIKEDGDYYKGPPLSVRAKAARAAVERNTDAFKDWWKRGGLLRDKIPTMMDSAANAARIAAKQTANDVVDRLKTAVGKEDKISRQALTFVVESGGDATKLAAMKSKIDGSTQYWAHGAKEAVAYAQANLAKLKPVADFYHRVTASQVDRENLHGTETLKRENYVPHVQDLKDDNAILFERGSGGNSASGYTKERVHDTYVDSMAAGIKPVSLDAVDLLEHRLNAGERRINMAKMVETLKAVKDPGTGDSVFTNLTIKQKANGSVETVVPRGYKSMFIGNSAVAVHKGYQGLFKALTGESWFNNSVGGRALMETASLAKHTTLLFDLYHPIRLMFYAAPHLGAVETIKKLNPFGSGEGLNILDYNRATLNRMEARGELTKEQLNSILSKKATMGLALKTGFNVGRISDNLYTTFLQKIPGIGGYNKWLFDQFQRGLMMETYNMEFERVKKGSSLPDEAIARQVSRDLNIRFGNLMNQSWVKNKSLTDMLRLVFLAPQWNEGLLRSEIGGVTGIGKSAMDSATQRRIVATTLTKNLGTMFAAYFVANQAINYITRGQPTWKNKDDYPGAKISAFIPDKMGSSEGFFLNPMSLMAEVTKQLVDKAVKNKSVLSAVDEVASNKLAPLGRLAKVIGTKTDWQGNHLSDWEAVKEGLKEGAPLPIQAPAIASAIKGKEAYPGEAQKTLLSTVGIKADGKKSSFTERMGNAAEAQYGKPFADLSLSQRLKVQDGVNASKPLQGDQATMEAARRNALEKELRNTREIAGGMPIDVSKWMKGHGLVVPSYEDTLHLGGKKLSLTDEEKQRYQSLVAEKYETFARKLMGNDSFDNMTPQRQKLMFDSRMTQARLQARAALLKTMQK